MITESLGITPHTHACMHTHMHAHMYKHMHTHSCCVTWVLGRYEQMSTHCRWGTNNRSKQQYHHIWFYEPNWGNLKEYGWGVTYRISDLKAAAVPKPTPEWVTVHENWKPGLPLHDSQAPQHTRVSFLAVLSVFISLGGAWGVFELRFSGSVKFVHIWRDKTSSILC